MLPNNIIFAYEKEADPQNHRVQMLTRSWTYTRMNSHICQWSPSFRVAIVWRRNGIDLQQEAKKLWIRTPGSLYFPGLCCSAAGIIEFGDSINVRCETEKKPCRFAFPHMSYTPHFDYTAEKKTPLTNSRNRCINDASYLAP